MIVGRGEKAGGAVQVLILGLSRQNVEKLTQGKPMLVRREIHGAGVPPGWEIAIVFGETEQALVDELMKMGALRSAQISYQPPAAGAQEQAP